MKRWIGLVASVMVFFTACQSHFTTGKNASSEIKTVEHISGDASYLLDMVIVQGADGSNYGCVYYGEKDTRYDGTTIRNNDSRLLENWIIYASSQNVAWHSETAIPLKDIDKILGYDGASPKAEWIGLGAASLGTVGLWSIVLTEGFVASALLIGGPAMIVGGAVALGAGVYVVYHNHQEMIINGAKGKVISGLLNPNHNTEIKWAAFANARDKLKGAERSRNVKCPSPQSIVKTILEDSRAVLNDSYHNSQKSIHFSHAGRDYKLTRAGEGELALEIDGEWKKNVRWNDLKEYLVKNTGLQRLQEWRSGQLDTANESVKEEMERIRKTTEAHYQNIQTTFDSKSLLRDYSIKDIQETKSIRSALASFLQK